MIEKIKGYWNIFVSHFSISSNKKTLSIIAVLVTAIALPLIVISAGSQQTYRQRASELVSPPTPPSPSPIVSSNRVFVTSTTYNGNLGGLSGADAKCQERAITAKLGGIWKAWLSDLSASAASRLTHSASPYKLAAYPSFFEPSAIIADNWNDLVDGTDLKTPIVADEFGKFWTSDLVWSNTGTNGNRDMTPGNGSCNNWTNASYNIYSRTGVIVSKSPDWTSSLTSNKACDASLMHLYCFEQSTPTTIPSPTPKPTATPTITPIATITPTPSINSCNACSADINKDNIISKADVNLINACFGKSGTKDCATADANKDGIVNINDIACATSQSGKQCIPFVCNACAADINGDGIVTGVDLNGATLCFGKPATVGCAPADVNKDGVVNIDDITCIRSNYNKKCVK